MFLFLFLSKLWLQTWFLITRTHLQQAGWSLYWTSNSSTQGSDFPQISCEKLQQTGNFTQISSTVQILYHTLGLGNPTVQSILVLVDSATTQSGLTNSLIIFTLRLWPLSLSTTHKLLCAREKRCNYKNVKMFFEQGSLSGRKHTESQRKAQQMINYFPMCKVINLKWNLISPAMMWADWRICLIFIQWAWMVLEGVSFVCFWRNHRKMKMRHSNQSNVIPGFLQNCLL